MPDINKCFVSPVQYTNKERSVEGLKSNVELVVPIMNKIELNLSKYFILQLFFNI